MSWFPLPERLTRMVSGPPARVKHRARVAFAARLVRTGIVVGCAVFFGFFPAVTTARVVLSSSLRQRGQIEDLGEWFVATQKRYDRWAENYLSTRRAATVQQEDVAATEWPLFGSVFFILSAEELVHSGELPLTNELRASLMRASSLIADPVSGTWVQQKWGPGYLEKENVFYRMLVMLGLNSYANITGDRQYAALVEKHAIGLRRELASAPYHVLDDYPGECYPSDVLWATAAIARVAAVPQQERDQLSYDVMSTLAGTLSDQDGLPPMLVDSRKGTVTQGARGCSTSGLLSFAYELDPRTAEDWYARYEEHYWESGHFVVGFREHVRGSEKSFSDVDSGPIVFGVGTVASLFGIGAARSAGRYDHAAPLTMEAVAATWPTPFGLLVPGVMGWAATDSWCLGETALLFAMTRPNRSDRSIAFTGSPPLAVRGFIFLYGALGAGLLLREWMFWRRWRRANR